MRKIIATFAALAALSTSVPVFASDFGYRTVHGMDQLHKQMVNRTITERVIDGSIEPDVRRVHTQGGEFYLASYYANMYVLEQLHCANARQSLGLESMSCLHFSTSK